MTARAAALLLFAVISLAAADITGIWAGRQSGRNGQQDDIAIRFSAHDGKLTGKLFGDEFDIPITEGSIIGEQFRFTIATTNYYSRSQTTFLYTGTIKGDELELIRERVLTPEEQSANRPPQKQTIKLKRLT